MPRAVHPDLLPADLTGTEVWRPQEGRFEFQPGPIFHPVLLADEINRAPAKVQSALLEAMGERQVTVGRHTYPLPPLFLVMATQNPIEQEGTFPLPEAQLDRFLMYVRIGYPEAETETEILRLARERARDAMQAQKPCRSACRWRTCSPRARPSSTCTSRPRWNATWSNWCWLRARRRATTRRWPTASPGARARVDRSRWNAARARLARGPRLRHPDDVRAVAPDVLRHRVLPSYEATAEGWDGEKLVAELLRQVPLP